MAAAVATLDLNPLVESLVFIYTSSIGRERSHELSLLLLLFDIIIIIGDTTKRWTAFVCSCIHWRIDGVPRTHTCCALLAGAHRVATELLARSDSGEPNHDQQTICERWPAYYARLASSLGAPKLTAAVGEPKSTGHHSFRPAPAIAMRSGPITMMQWFVLAS